MTDNSVSISQGGGIEIVGDANVVSGNVVDATDAPDALEAFDVKGDPVGEQAVSNALANMKRTNKVVSGVGGKYLST